MYSGGSLQIEVIQARKCQNSNEFAVSINLVSINSVSINTFHKTTSFIIWSRMTLDLSHVSKIYNCESKKGSQR